MSLWRQLTRGLRGLTRRGDADRDVTDEVEHYLEQATAAHLARGLPPEEARRAARLELGSVPGMREEVRRYGWENAVENLAGDLRYAARRLATAPGSTAITVLTLALGIGATTAIFSAVNPILFASLPYPHPDRIVAIREINSDGSASQGTFGMFRGVANRTRSFDALAVLKPWQPTISGGESPERLEAERVSAGYFRVLGVIPLLGRDFQASDDRLNGPNVVILSDGLWRRRFGGNPGIIGRRIVLDEPNASGVDDHFEVIGVMPPGFENVLGPQAELWAPLQYDLSQNRAWGHHLRTVGRLRSGVALGEADRELGRLAQEVLAEQHPQTYGPGVALHASSLQAEVTRGVRPALLATLGAVFLVLLIACVNVTNLLLARGVQRRGEFALRAALGAGRERLVRQVLTESLLLALVGGVLGIALAALGVRALVALSPPGLPRAGSIGVNRVVLVFGLGLTTLIGLAFGLTPALQAAGNAPQADLQLATRRTAGGHRRTRGALVVVEVALALMLLASSGLLLQSLRRLFAVETGFDSTRLLTLQVQTAGHRFDTDSATHRFFARVLDEVRRVPGVISADLASQLPLSGDLDEYGARIEGNPDRGFSVFRYAVSPGYTGTMRIPLRRGRALDERDAAGAPPAVLLSESLARHMFPGLDPLGRLIRIGPLAGAPYTVVGVVGDIRQMSLALNETDAVYTTTTQWHWADNVMSLVIRARGEPLALAPAIREAIWSVDRDQPVVRVATMDDLLAASAADRRFALVLFEAFALAALVLAAAGIYGVLAGSVAERTREIGVRAALGATRGNLIAMVLRQGMALTTIGVALGLAGSAVATRGIAALLFGVTRHDPATFLGVTAILAAVALLACGVPAWRAARVDAATTLRTD